MLHLANHLPRYLTVSSKPAAALLYLSIRLAFGAMLLANSAQDPSIAYSTCHDHPIILCLGPGHSPTMIHCNQRMQPATSTQRVWRLHRRIDRSLVLILHNDLCSILIPPPTLWPGVHWQLTVASAFTQPWPPSQAYH